MNRGLVAFLTGAVTLLTLTYLGWWMPLAALGGFVVGFGLRDRVARQEQRQWRRAEDLRQRLAEAGRRR